MSHNIRYIFLFWIILFLFIPKGFPVKYDNGLEASPSLKHLVIDGDSVFIIPGDSLERELFLKHDFVLDHGRNNIIFELSHQGNLEYQYFLEGFDNVWSQWKQVSFKEYTNLPAGKYVFHARYRSDDSRMGEKAIIAIRVLPIWYFTWPAMILFVILLSLMIWALYNQMNLRFARKLYILEQIINSRTEDLIGEKEKSDKLLANVLPKNTASEIMEKGKASKIKYNFVTVLFSDIQGFTEIAEEMNPEVLIDELDKFFFYFDSIVEKYGIEKIKTIGDAYMCAGGIPEKNRTNPVEVILAAFEMMLYMKKLKETTVLEGMKLWDIRIGIHTGTVVAGVVGQKKLSYDIWGDTVNTASRMESSGEGGKINISGTTYEFVKDFFTCEYRGKMPVKYKGELEMYFVTGIVPELCDESGGPNREFILKIQKIKLQDIEEMIIKMFDDEAPPNLYFHNSTLLRNICNQVELLSNAENLGSEEQINLKMAAIFLLTGYIYDYEKPLEASQRMVENILPRYGFDSDNIESTKRIIRNSFTDKRETLSDSILHDARYDYLGRVDYMKLTDKLYRERTEYGKYPGTKSWIEIQKKLLKDHDFITGTARLLRSIPADDQVKRLRELSQ